MGAHVWLAGAAGAWGDSALSTRQILDDGRSDYVVYEALAEITMAILARARARDPDSGYATDIIESIASNAAEFADRSMKVVTNAGGTNPEAAASVIAEAGDRAGVGWRVATVTGDELDHDGGALSVNAYLGARPVAAALGAGADVVVTGRVADSALFLGPLLHEFGWGHGDYDLLSTGSLAGHLLECGPQSTGGLLTDWERTTSWSNPGYPLARVTADGGLVVTAPEGTDALVDIATVAEQLLYEIADPSAYVLPDVVCDWTGVSLEQMAGNAVAVSGARGRAPTPTLKACAQVPDGWRATSLVFIGGRDAVAKARRAAADIIARGERILAGLGLGGFSDTHVEVLGAEDTYGAHAASGSTREVVLKVAVHHRRREAVERFVREVPSLALAGPPGVSGGGAGLPRATPLIRLDCFLVLREEVQAEVRVDGEAVEFRDVAPGEGAEPGPSAHAPEGAPATTGGGVTVPLLAVAHGRSGDKGGDVNIGIRARHPDFMPVLDSVGADDVAEWLSHLGADGVDRYVLAGIDALNFVLRGGLGHGGTASLRFDPQGKALAQQLLDMPVRIDSSLLDHASLHTLPEVDAARRRHSPEAGSARSIEE